MLADLPPEILYHIASYLPTASALAHLAQTCHRLHTIITADDWRICRAFISHRFPHIDTPPFWKDAAQALTSRSRALDKHAVIGRFVGPSRDAAKVGSHQAIRRDNPTHGYRPAIDSYEFWNGKTWEDRKEVLAWSAADTLVMRIRQTGRGRNEQWFVFDDLDHISSHDDICGLHLLRPNHYAKERDREHIIFGRMRGELVHLAIAPVTSAYEYKQRFLTFGVELERTDLSNGPDPILAAHFSNGSIAFYSTTSEDAEVQAFARLRIDPDKVARNKHSKFISPSRFAVATGRLEDSLTISTISQERLSLDRVIGVDSLDLDSQVGLAQKTNVTAITPLSPQTSHPSSGNIFLAAWGDRAVRLHDLRSDRPYEKIYRDNSDHNPIYCVHPLGNDRFVVGAGGDAVVKIFDIRMPKNYTYLDAGTSLTSLHSHSPNHRSGNGVNNHMKSVVDGIRYPRKDLSIFLSYQPQVLNRRRARSYANRSYRGAIYTISSPSLLSPTLYTGIANGVVRLDFASTDDLTGPCRAWHQDRIDLNPSTANVTTFPVDRVLDLSGYERPDPRDTTTPLKLRKQQPFKSVGDEDIVNEELTGWDRRWERLGAPGAWRRGGVPLR
ncbi:F-box domain protein [Aspergillus terreus]|uniref:F-box domain protein n=1 Tax=Aspergillus terreus TaxID=33178 RepID=A0A5M3YYG0_ASPTE|nr:hypothetical protein ATETN484_0006017200 [Aspergillus terreus]GFF19913.1 F-box domain protein [Aspergillus terreus]